MATETYKIVLRVEGEKELFSLRWDLIRNEVEIMYELNIHRSKFQASFRKGLESYRTTFIG